jgi:hypothetical protein
MASAPEPPADGVDFPLTDGRRSTSGSGRRVLAAAAEAVDPALAQRVRGASDWRHGYPALFAGLLEASLASADAAVAAARAGLAALHAELSVRRDGQVVPLARLDEVPAGPPPELVAAGGHGAHPRHLVVPYRGEELSGDALVRQVERWRRDGVVEPGCAAALEAVVRSPEWLELGDTEVLVLGAGAEMAPTELLLAWGTRVVAVDVGAPGLWSRLLAQAEVGTGRLEVPARPSAAGASLAERAGVDLLADLPELLALLRPRAGGLLMSQYLYADGGQHVLVNGAADALAARLLAAGARGVATLATPTDVFAVPEDAVEASRAALARSGAGPALARRLTGGRVFDPAYPRLVTRGDGRRVGLVDAYVVQQGPNYALAKAVQRWRATVARAEGARASLTVAPMTLTRSVVKRRLMATGYEGTARFGVEVFAPETSRALTAALLVHDLRAPGAAADPATALGHPEDLPAATAAHGGLWRMPYATRSVLPLAVLAGAVRRPVPGQVLRRPAPAGSPPRR